MGGKDRLALVRAICLSESGTVDCARTANAPEINWATAKSIATMNFLTLRCLFMNTTFFLVADDDSHRRLVISFSVPYCRLPLLALIHGPVIPFTASHEETRKPNGWRNLNFEVMPFGVLSETRRSVADRVQVSQLQSNALERIDHLGGAAR